MICTSSRRTSSRRVRPVYEALESRRLLSAGDVDPSFGGDGSVTLPTQAPGLSYDPVMVLQPDGKLLLAQGNDLQRFNVDGMVDTAFAANGLLAADDTIIDLEVAAGGKIVIAVGQFSASVKRFSADGSPDATFGIRGSSGIGSLDRVALQSDGRIIVCNGGTLRRLNIDGSEDNTFVSIPSTNDYALPPISQPIRLAVDGNDKILVGATLDYYGTPYLRADGTPFTLARFNADGTVDTTFASNGFYSATSVGDLIPLSSGKILITSDRSDGKTGVIRLSDGGQAEATIAKLSSGMRLVPAPDGKLVAFGSSEIVRLNGDGTSDDSFGRVITNGYDNLHSASMQVASALPITDGATLAITRNSALEPRLYRLQGDDTPAGSITLSGGLLSIAGTSDDDAIDVQTVGTDLFVRVTNSFGRAFGDAAVDTITLDAGAGDDTIWQRTSHDSTLVGGDGSDTIRAGDGADFVSGGAGAELINGGIGNDVLNGDGGKDSVYGSAGDDTIFGGAGSDHLYGGDGADHIEGQGGNDRISGGGGADILRGGAGDDTFLTSGDSAIDEIRGDRGFDTTVGDPDELLTGIEQIL